MRPDHVLIAGQRFDIAYTDTLDVPNTVEPVGTTSTRTQQIEILNGQAHDQERDTNLHEALHACCQVAGVPIGNSKEEEASIRILAPILLDCLRRNRQFTEYLLEERTA